MIWLISVVVFVTVAAAIYLAGMRLVRGLELIGSRVARN